MRKFGIWLGTGRYDIGKFYIDELDTNNPESKWWSGTFIRSIFIEKGGKLTYPKPGHSIGWENYHDLFDTLLDAERALVKRTFNEI
jgi:hypothetical protein